MAPAASAVPVSMFKETHKALPLVASMVLSVSHLPLPLPLPLPLHLPFLFPLRTSDCHKTLHLQSETATAARAATEARVVTAARVATATTGKCGDGSLLRSIP